MWTRPWTVKQEFTKQSEEENRIYYEPRCVEGNIGFPSMMKAARQEDREFAEGRGPDPLTQGQRIGSCRDSIRCSSNAKQRQRETIMLDRRSGSMITVAIAAAAARRRHLRVHHADVGPGAGSRPARVEGKPNFSGIWQANNEANWDLQAHAALPAAVTQQGVYPL